MVASDLKDEQGTHVDNVMRTRPDRLVQLVRLGTRGHFCSKSLMNPPYSWIEKKQWEPQTRYWFNPSHRS